MKKRKRILILVSSLLFCILSAKALYAETLEYKNNSNNGNGGAIYLTENSSYTFSKSTVTFLNNQANGNGSSGGAIYVGGENAVLNIDLSLVTFSSNTANFGGGAIELNNKAKSEFRNSEIIFEYNTARRNSAGALHITNHSQQIIEGSTVSFILNKTSSNSGNGGAIDVWNGSTFTVKESNIKFENNQTKKEGGAIYVGLNSSATISASTLTFSNNSSNNGGAIYTENNSFLEIFKSSITFEKNSANINGGALYISSGSNYSLIASTVMFSGNNVVGSGGAIYVEGANSLLGIYSSSVIFSSNTANNGGGAIELKKAKSEFKDSEIIFEYNTAKGNSAGALHILGESGVGSEQKIKNSTVTFRGNQMWRSDRSGGAIDLWENSNLEIIDSSLTFENNISSGNAGAVYAGTNSSIDISSVDISSLPTVNFINNSSLKDGGAVYINSKSSLQVTSGTLVFDSNKAGGNGGAIYSTDNSSVTFSNSDIRFESNSSSSNGGAIYSDNSKYDFSSSTIIFENNRYFAGSNFAGGAIYSDSSDFDFSDTNLTFVYNRAKTKGGAIYSENSGHDFSSSTIIFSKNQSDISTGGAIYSKSSSFNFTNSNVTFMENQASGAGNAIYSNNSKYNFTSSIVSFMDNKALGSGSGGAIYISSDSEMIFDNSKIDFIGNITNTDGGAISAENSELKFKNSDLNFLNNISLNGNGGAIYANNSTITFETGGIIKFQGNKDSGGNGNIAIYADRNSNIEFNTSAGGKVEMYDAIGGSSNGGIIISGDGDFNYYSDYEVEKEKRANISIKGGNLNLSDDAKLYANEFSISNDSSLNITVNERGAFRNKTIELIEYNTLSGEFSYSSAVVNGTFVDISDENNMKLDYGESNDKLISLILRRKEFISLGGSFNQKEVEKVYDWYVDNNKDKDDIDTVITLMESAYDLNTQRNYLAQIAGYFTANVIRSGGGVSDRDEVYNRLNDGDEEKINKGIWTHGKINKTKNGGDDNSLGDYNDTVLGASVGYDMPVGEKGLILGFYGKMNKHNISQNPGNSADITNIGAGIYGGYTINSWEIKALLSAGFDDYSTERYIPFDERKTSADFSGVTINADTEGAFKMALNDIIKLKYYAGLEMRNSSYGDIKEKGAQSLDLNISGGTYQRIAARAGVGLNGKKEKLGWYCGAEYKLLFKGDTPEIESRFNESQTVFKSRGSKEGTGEIGLKAGGSFDLTPRLKLFTDISYHTSDKYDNIYGNLGLRWLFTALSDAKVYKQEKLSSKDLQAEQYRLVAERKKAEKEKAGQIKKQKKAEAEKQKLMAWKQRITKEESARILKEKKKMEARYKAEEKERESSYKAAEKEREKLLKMAQAEERRKIEAKEKEKQKRIEKEMRKTADEQRRLNALIKEKEKEIRLSEKNRRKKEIQENKKRKEEEKQIRDKIKVYEKNQKKVETEIKTKADKQKDKYKSEIKGISENYSESKKDNTQILEYEIMLAEQRKKEEARIKAKALKIVEAKRMQTLSSEKNSAVKEQVKTSGEISDVELAAKKKEIEKRMFRAIISSFEVKFMPDKYELSPHWQIEIAKQSEALKKREYTKISIEGHTDSSEMTPKKLSRLRARAVFDEFVRNGIPAEKMSYIGMSSVLPAASNDDEAGRMQNRRVVIVVE